MKQIIKSSYSPNFRNSLIEFNDKELSLIHYILTSEINLGNQKFNMNGYIDDYAPKRPKFLFNHGLNGMWGQEYLNPMLIAMLMLGRNEWIRPVNDKLRAKTIFDKDNELAVYLYNGYKNEIWTDFSVFWFLPAEKGEIVEDSAEYNDNDGIMYVNKFWVREYSAVFEGKDTGAVADMLSNANEFKTPELKVFLNSLDVNSQIQDSQEVSNLKTEIENLKKQINGNGQAEELYKYTNNAIEQTSKLLVEKFSDKINSIFQILDTLNNNQINFKNEIKSEVDKQIAGVIRETMGVV